MSQKHLMTSFKLSMIQKNAQILNSDFEKPQKSGKFSLLEATSNFQELFVMNYGLESS